MTEDPAPVVIASVSEAFSLHQLGAGSRQKMVPGLCSLICLFLLLGVVKGSVNIIHSDNFGITFRYEPGRCSVIERVDGKVQFNFEDAAPIAWFEHYDLPGKRLLIGIPQTGGVKVSFKVEEAGVVENKEPAAVPFIPGPGTEDRSLKTEDSRKPTADSPVDVGESQTLRSVRFITLTLTPVQFESEARRLRYFKRIDVEIKFEKPATLNLKPDPLDELIKKMLINGEEAIKWKVDREPWTGNRGRKAKDGGRWTENGNPYGRFPYWVKIKIGTTGIYRITGAELAAIGVSLAGIDPKTIALWTLGEHQPLSSYPDTLTPVGISVTGEADGSFDAHDTIIFYCLGPDHWINACSAYVKNLYARENVYWLTWGGEPGKRMPVISPSDTTQAIFLTSGKALLHQEVDADCPARSGLLWIWRQINKSTAEEKRSFSCDLLLKYPIQVSRLTGRLFKTAQDTLSAQILFKFNGREIGAFPFGKRTSPDSLDFRIDTILPVSYSKNTLELQLKGNGEKTVYLDYLEVDYRRRLSLSSGQLHFLIDTLIKVRFNIRDVKTEPIVLDVTEPLNPKCLIPVVRWPESLGFCTLISERREFAAADKGQLLRPNSLELKNPGRLWDPAVYADYWIITPKSFYSPAQELARFRNNRIMGIPDARAAVVTLEELYDDFCFGLEEPWAIKNFLKTKLPAYVLLVGDATYDYKNNLQRVKTPGVPAYETPKFGLDPGAHDRPLALDIWYADIDGGGSAPDLILARLPVRTKEEFSQFVNKLTLYETGEGAYWQRRYLLLADDEYERYPDRPDELKFEHIRQCERSALIANARLDPVKVYLTEFPFLGAKSKPQANQELLRQLNLGVVLWVFFGHGAADALTHENVLTVARVPEVNNGERLPFCFFGSCSVGRFDDTRCECIAEEMVRMKGGAIATVAASTSTPSGNNEIFARNMLIPLFSPPESSKTIGYCFFAAWPTDKSYHLFGDPATVLRMPPVSTQTISITPDTLRPGLLWTANCSLSMEQGKAEWRLFGPARLRGYDSPAGYGTTYLLSGDEVARGQFRVKDGRFYCEGFFPYGRSLDTVFVGNGYYAPVLNSCRLSSTIAKESVSVALLLDMIPFDSTPIASQDSTGPIVNFFSDGRRLYNGAIVPANFELEGVVFDSSGILIAPVAGAQPCLFVNQRINEISLTDLFKFEEGSYSSARFKLPLSLSGPVDSVFVLVADNFLNRSTVRVTLQPITSSVLKIDSVLVYPNPVKREAYFTFILTQPAAVRVRIYTIGGRLVQDLGEIPGKIGYNQIFWDGKDRDGVFLSNGIYLFTVLAQINSNSKGTQRVTVRDKFLVVH